MQKQEIINQVRLVYDFAYGVSKAAANKCLNKVDRADLDRIVGGLWLIVKSTLGESFRIEADGQDVSTPAKDSGDVAVDRFAPDCIGTGSMEESCALKEES